MTVLFMSKVSVIITSYNNSHNIEKCLESLTNQSYNQNDTVLEIIVVDSGSTDDSIEILNKYKYYYKDKLRVVFKPAHLPRLSPAAARNLGVGNSRGDILIFSDSDCIFPSTWIRDLLDSFKNYQVNCILGSREPDIGKGLGTFIRRYAFILYSNKYTISKPLIISKETLQEGSPLVLLAGNNFAIKKEIWEKIGGMKPVFRHPAGEDVMMEIELIQQSYNILFNPNIRVVHVHPISLLKLIKKAFRSGEATYLLSKYSNNFVNWRHFAQRGHIVHFKKAFLKLLLIFLLLLVLISLSLHYSTIMLILLTIFLITSFTNVLNIKKKLEFILKSKGENHRKTYTTSLIQLFWFHQAHTFLKIITLMGFVRCYLIRK